MTYHEVLFSLLIFFIGADGETETATLHVLDHPPYYKCLSYVACTRVEDRTIFLDINEFHRTDDCGRNPLTHELVELKYMGENVHTNCNLNVQIVHSKYIA